MIPILYEGTETEFRTDGLGRLPDCGMCHVTEERNGIYECQFTYPVNGHNFSLIQEGRIILCTHDETKSPEPFDIYARSEPIEGVVTFYAHHVSYRLGRVILRPVTAGSCAAALTEIKRNTYNTCPFTFWTDKTTSGTFKTKIPMPVKEALGGSSGSILDVYGKAEYMWYRFAVRLYQDRGTDTGVTIRYGVNLTGYNRELNYSSAYNACVPFWADSEGSVVVTPGVVYAQGYDSTNAEPVTMDLSSEFEEAPTEQELADMAASRMASNRSWLPSDNIMVSFVPLWQTEEYADVAPLQRVRLCDRVNVEYGPSGVLIEGVQVIKVVYDVLLDRYDSMELGTARASFEQMIKADITGGILQDFPSKSYLQQALDYATDLIRGGLGGHVIIGTDTDGHPDEILIMDTADKATAVNVWRWNLNGLAHSHNGYNGPFNDVAITMDGQISANAITTGSLDATIIKTGILTDHAGNNYWDLDSGEFRLSSTVTFGGKTIGEFAEDAVDDLSQQQIFNILTNNGQTQGIYLQNGKLYINGDYLQSGTISANRINGGTLTLGGANNANGVLRVLDANGNQVGLWNNSGATIQGKFTSTGLSGVNGIVIDNGVIKSEAYGQVQIRIQNGFANQEQLVVKTGEIFLESDPTIMIERSGNQYDTGQTFNLNVMEQYGFITFLRFKNGLLVEAKQLN